MAFSKGGVSYSVYTIEEGSQIPTTEDLNFMAFVPIDDTTEELSAGLVDFTDMSRVDFSMITPEIGEYICLGYRVDKRSVSGATKNRLVWEKIRELQDQDQASGGQGVISAARRREIVEQVKLFLLSRAVPVPKKYDIVINREAGLVYLEKAPNPISERMVGAVEYVLGAEITLMDATYLAYNAVDNHDDLPGEDGLCSGFLAYMLNEGEHEHASPLFVLGTLSLHVPNSTGGSPLQVRCSDPSLREQILTLIQEGATLQVAQLGVNSFADEGAIPTGVDLTLLEDVPATVGQGLQVSGVKLPRVDLDMQEDGEVTAEGTFLLRMELIEQLTTVVQHTFRSWARGVYA